MLLQTQNIRGAHRRPIKSLEYLVQHGAPIDQPLLHGASGLCFSAGKGFIDIVRKLIKLGANVNQADTRGATGCIMAAQNGCYDVLKLLCESGADIEKADISTGFTPIEAAKVRKKESLILDC